MVKWFRQHRHAAEWHPTDEELLLYLDGEAAARAATAARAHLEACWPCRVRAEKLQEAITEFVEYRNYYGATSLPPPPQGWRTFERALSKLAEEESESSLWQTVRGSFPRFFRTPRLAPRAAMFVLLLLAAWALWRWPGAPPVSANELLQKAALAEAQELRRAAQPVIHQKLSVRRKASARADTATWELWREMATARVRYSAQANGGAVLRELQKLLQANRLEPLSPASFAQWRQTLAAKHEEVSEIVLANNLRALALRTVPQTPGAAAGLTEASLIVRAHDWRPVEQRLKARSATGEWEYIIAEAAFEVLSAEQLGPAFFSEANAARGIAATPSATVAPGVAPEAANGTAAAQLAEPVDLDATEAEVRFALHQLGSDLGEPIEIVRRSPNRIEVRGLVNTAARKQELLAALRRIPHVALQIKTVDEAAREAANTPMRGAAANDEPERTEVAGGGPPVQQLLEQRGLNADEMRELANRALALAEAALADAWALRRLAERYGPEELARLQPDSRRKVGTILRNHLGHLRRRSQQSRALLSPVLPPNAAPPSAAAWPSTWPAFVAPLFQTVQREGHLTDSLFAAAPGAPLDAQTALQQARELLGALTLLEVRLPQLETELAGEFLNDK